MAKVRLLLVFLVLFAPVASASAKEQKGSVHLGDALVGDLNGDSEVDIVDVQLALRIATGLKGLPQGRLALADLAPTGPGEAVGDGKITIADVAKLFSLYLGRSHFKSVSKVVVEEEGMIILQNIPLDLDFTAPLVIKEDGEQKIAIGGNRWDLQGNFLCRFQGKAPDAEEMRRVIGVFQDGTPIYEEDLSFNYDKEGNFSPITAFYSAAMGLQYIPDKEDPQEFADSKLIFGSLQTKEGDFSYLCLKRGSDKDALLTTVWLTPLHFGLDGNYAVPLEDGRIAILAEKFQPEYLSTNLELVVTKRVEIDKGFAGVSPWEFFVGGQTREITLPGLSEVRLAPGRVVSEGKIVATTAPIFPGELSVWDLGVPLFDYQDKITTLMVVIDPDSKEASLSAFTPKALEAEVEVWPLGVSPLPLEGKVRYGEEKFFVSYLIYTKKKVFIILYPAHLEERLVEIIRD